jgi:hypothetical protein
MLFEVFLLLLLLLPFSSIVKSNEVIGDYHLCHTNLCPHIFSTSLLRNVSIHLQRNSSATIACLTRRIEIFDVIFHLMYFLIFFIFKYPDVGAELTGGCYGFAPRYMHWPEQLIVGGTTKNKTGHITR